MTHTKKRAKRKKSVPKIPGFTSKGEGQPIMLDNDPPQPLTSEQVQITNVQEPIKTPEGIPPPQPMDPTSEPDKMAAVTKGLLSPKIIGSVVSSVFLTAAKYGGDHWALKDHEKENLSEALCNYLNVVLPELLKNHPELFVLGLTSVVILAPRVMESVKRRKSRKTKGNIEQSLDSTNESDPPAPKGYDSGGNLSISGKDKKRPGSSEKVV